MSVAFAESRVLSASEPHLPMPLSPCVGSVLCAERDNHVRFALNAGLLVLEERLCLCHTVKQSGSRHRRTSGQVSMSRTSPWSTRRKGTNVLFEATRNVERRAAPTLAALCACAVVCVAVVAGLRHHNKQHACAPAALRHRAAHKPRFNANVWVGVVGRRTSSHRRRGMRKRSMGSRASPYWKNTAHITGRPHNAESDALAPL